MRHQLFRARRVIAVERVDHLQGQLGHEVEFQADVVVGFLVELRGLQRQRLVGGTHFERRLAEDEPVDAPVHRFIGRHPGCRGVPVEQVVVASNLLRGLAGTR